MEEAESNVVDDKDELLTSNLLLALSDFNDINVKGSRNTGLAKNVRETRIDLTNHLFTSLKSSLQQQNYLTSAKILKYLIENKLCSNQFVLQLFSALFSQKDCGFLVMNGLSTINKDKENCEENRLTQLAYELSQDNFAAAAITGSRFEGRKTDKSRDFAGEMVLGYATLLKYLTSKSSAKSLSADLLTSFKRLEEGCFMPLIAEAYTATIIELGNPEETKAEEKAEAFLKNYVDTEFVNSGILAPLHALEIVKIHMPQSQNLIAQFLEKIALKDPYHDLVLDLSWKYLCNDPSLDCLDPESQPSKANNKEKFTMKQHNNLSKCLELTFSFLDGNSGNVRGWNILSQTLVKVCQSGAVDCALTVVNLWHQQRLHWWTCFSEDDFSSPKSVQFITDRALVCFILDSASHEYVLKALALPNSALLKSLIKQLHLHKSRFDLSIQSLQSTVSNPSRCLTRDLNSGPKKPHSTPVIKSSRKLSNKAASYSNYMSVSMPLVRSDSNNSNKTNCYREDALSLYNVPMPERLSRRYEFSKKPDRIGDDLDHSEDDDEPGQLIGHTPKKSSFPKNFQTGCAPNMPLPLLGQGEGSIVADQCDSTESEPSYRPPRNIGPVSCPDIPWNERLRCAPITDPEDLDPVKPVPDYVRYPKGKKERIDALLLRWQKFLDYGVWESLGTPDISDGSGSESESLVDDSDEDDDEEEIEVNPNSSSFYVGQTPNLEFMFAQPELPQPPQEVTSSDAAVVNSSSPTRRLDSRNSTSSSSSGVDSLPGSFCPSPDLEFLNPQKQSDPQHPVFDFSNVSFQNSPNSGSQITKTITQIIDLLDKEDQNLAGDEAESDTESKVRLKNKKTSRDKSFKSKNVSASNLVNKTLIVNKKTPVVFKEPLVPSSDSEDSSSHLAKEILPKPSQTIIKETQMFPDPKVGLSSSLLHKSQTGIKEVPPPSDSSDFSEDEAGPQAVSSSVLSKSQAYMKKTEDSASSSEDGDEVLPEASSTMISPNGMKVKTKISLPSDESEDQGVNPVSSLLKNDAPNLGVDETSSGSSDSSKEVATTVIEAVKSGSVGSGSLEITLDKNVVQNDKGLESRTGSPEPEEGLLATLGDCISISSSDTSEDICAQWDENDESKSFISTQNMREMLIAENFSTSNSKRFLDVSSPDLFQQQFSSESEDDEEDVLNLTQKLFTVQNRLSLDAGYSKAAKPSVPVNNNLSLPVSSLRSKLSKKNKNARAKKSGAVKKSSMATKKQTIVEEVESPSHQMKRKNSVLSDKSIPVLGSPNRLFKSPAVIRKSDLILSEQSSLENERESLISELLQTCKIPLIERPIGGKKIKKKKKISTNPKSAAFDDDSAIGDTVHEESSHGHFSLDAGYSSASKLSSRPKKTKSITSLSDSSSIVNQPQKIRKESSVMPQKKVIDDRPIAPVLIDQVQKQPPEKRKKSTDAGRVAKKSKKQPENEDDERNALISEMLKGLKGFSSKERKKKSKGIESKRNTSTEEDLVEQILSSAIRQPKKTVKGLVQATATGQEKVKKTSTKTAAKILGGIQDLQAPSCSGIDKPKSSLVSDIQVPSKGMNKPTKSVRPTEIVDDERDKIISKLLKSVSSIKVEPDVIQKGKKSKVKTTSKLDSKLEEKVVTKSKKSLLSQNKEEKRTYKLKQKIEEPLAQPGPSKLSLEVKPSKRLSIDEQNLLLVDQLLSAPHSEAGSSQSRTKELLSNKSRKQKPVEVSQTRKRKVEMKKTPNEVLPKLRKINIEIQEPVNNSFADFVSSCLREFSDDE